MGFHKGWSPDDYRRMAADGFTMAETARELNVRPQTVRSMSLRYGIAFVRDGRGRKPNGGTVPQDEAANS